MLTYIGNGKYIVGIPARDLDPDEVARFGEKYLLATGLYKRPPAPKAEKAAVLTPAKEKENEK